MSEGHSFLITDKVPHSVLSDGSALACRRLSIKIGKLPEPSFEAIFLENELMRRFRRPESFAGCGSCDFYAVCRGCPAAVHSLTGNCFAENPLCFRSALPSTPPEDCSAYPSVPMDISNAEEWALVAKSKAWVREVIREMETNAELASLYLTLSGDPAARRAFLRDPAAFAGSGADVLRPDHFAFLIQRVMETAGKREADQKRTDWLTERALVSVLDKFF